MGGNWGRIVGGGGVVERFRVGCPRSPRTVRLRRKLCSIWSSKAFFEEGDLTDDQRFEAPVEMR